VCIVGSVVCAAVAAVNLGSSSTNGTLVGAIALVGAVVGGLLLFFTLRQ
jgi:hypothetical protein